MNWPQRLKRVMEMTKNKDYTTCPQCGVRIKKKNLAAHMLRVHGVEEEEGKPKSHSRPVWPVAAAVIIGALLLVVGIYYLTVDDRGTEHTGVTQLYPGNNTIKTSDGWELECNYNEGNRTMPAVIFIHGMNENHRVWDTLAGKFNDRGYATAAFDLRGHGESLKHNGKIETLASFSEEDFVNMVRDASAVIKALKDTGYESYIIVGASIGANIALVTGATYTSVLGVALLSPGMNYHGIDGESAAKEYGSKRAYMAAARGDSYPYNSTIKLATYMPMANVEYFNGTDHGTNLLKDGADSSILDWVDRNRW